MELARLATLATPSEAAVRAPAPPEGRGFGERIRDLLDGANRELVQAEEIAGQHAAGEVDSVETILALAKADLTLRHLVTLRNRMLEAYQEVMRLPL